MTFAEWRSRVSKTAFEREVNDNGIEGINVDEYIDNFYDKFPERIKARENARKIKGRFLRLRYPDVFNYHYEKWREAKIKEIGGNYGSGNSIRKEYDRVSSGDSTDCR